MFPQKSASIPQWIAGIALVIFLVNNPEKAAAVVNKVVNALITFANGLG